MWLCDQGEAHADELRSRSLDLLCAQTVACVKKEEEVNK